MDQYCNLNFCLTLYALGIIAADIFIIWDLIKLRKDDRAVFISKSGFRLVLFSLWSWVIVLFRLLDLFFWFADFLHSRILKK